LRVRYTRRAFFDREAIFDYLAERSPSSALNVQRAIVQTIRKLEGYPELGRRCPAPAVAESLTRIAQNRTVCGSLR
jgi:plasmid stabilization system protein ParE